MLPRFSCAFGAAACELTHKAPAMVPTAACGCSQDKEPAPGRPRVDDSAVRAVLEGPGKWLHDKYEGGRPRGRLAGRVGRPESGFKLCVPPPPWGCCPLPCIMCRAF